MTKAKYEDDTGESGWVEAEAGEKVEEGADEKLAKEVEEARGKERVRDKIGRLVGELRSGRVFGAARKALWNEVEALVGRLKGEETVGEMEKEREKEEEKLAKKAV